MSKNEAGNDSDKILKEDQELRSETRIEFLRLLEVLKGREIEAKTVEGNSVFCRFEEVDRSVTQLGVAGLKTPTGVIPAAVLRFSDLDFIRFQSATNSNPSSK